MTYTDNRMTYLDRPSEDCTGHDEQNNVTEMRGCLH